MLFKELLFIKPGEDREAYRSAVRREHAHHEELLSLEREIEALRADCARLEEALAAEIEACAQVAEDHRLGETLIRASMEADRNHVSWYGRVSRTIASAIRARAALVRMNNGRR